MCTFTCLYIKPITQSFISKWCTSLQWHGSTNHTEYYRLCIFDSYMDEFFNYTFIDLYSSHFPFKDQPLRFEYIIIIHQCFWTLGLIALYFQGLCYQPWRLECWEVEHHVLLSTIIDHTLCLGTLWSTLEAGMLRSCSSCTFIH